MTWLPKKEFKRIFSKVPRLCVDLVIKDKTGIVLVLREIAPWKGLWHVPGGTVYFGESLKQAAVRVAKEETGLKVEVVKPLIATEFLEEIKSANRHTVSVGLLCKIKGGKLKGSFQGETVRIFKTIPKRTIAKHKKIIDSAK